MTPKESSLKKAAKRNGGIRPANSPKKTSRLVAQRVEEAVRLISSIGIPIRKQSTRNQERMALVLFAVANMRPETPWQEAAVFQNEESWKLATREIISFQNKYWGQAISPGSYDDIRRKDLVFLVQAGIVLASAGNPNASTNNPSRRYAISPEAADLLHKFGSAETEEAARLFVLSHGSLDERLERPRPRRVEAKLPDGKLIELTSGSHNILQKAIIEEFIPRYTSGGVVLYLGDTSKKSLHIEKEELRKLGFQELAHELLPDVVVYDRDRKWIFLIEAVHSSNPISKMRHVALETFTKDCSAPRVYVSVFANRPELRKWICDISWETEVWLVENPDHMIHFNGD